jgi:hypothetical protein
MKPSENGLIVYKGIGLKKGSKISQDPKYFVFDLDETIGSFSGVYTVFQCIEYLKKMNNVNLVQDTEELVHALLDLYPEFFRYGIEIILEYLYKQKETQLCKGVHIYTNNTCLPYIWTYMITNYIEKKWDLPGLFDTHIRAYSINGKIMEYSRTTNDKTHKDLLKILNLPYNSVICFIDNAIHTKMMHRYVYYMRPKPYFHSLKYSEIIDRFISSQIGIEMNEKFGFTLKPQMINWYNNTSWNKFENNYNELELDLKNSKRILKNIIKVFNLYRQRPYTQRIVYND